MEYIGNYELYLFHSINLLNISSPTKHPDIRNNKLIFFFPNENHNLTLFSIFQYDGIFVKVEGWDFIEQCFSLILQLLNI